MATAAKSTGVNRSRTTAHSATSLSARSSSRTHSAARMSPAQLCRQANRCTPLVRRLLPATGHGVVDSTVSRAAPGAEVII